MKNPDRRQSAMQAQKVGVVGLGNMGGGIARNFQRAGVALAVWDITAAARDALAALPGV
jgi:3-hydroxyisobutyrate dehydrogenase-like beta-hydroxyacid dehydrogenase